MFLYSLALCRIMCTKLTTCTMFIKFTTVYTPLPNVKMLLQAVLFSSPYNVSFMHHQGVLMNCPN